MNAHTESTVREFAWISGHDLWCCHHVGGKGNWVMELREERCRHCGGERPETGTPKPTPTPTMTDIVERLRNGWMHCDDEAIMAEAATEIEKLRTSLGVAVAEIKARRNVGLHVTESNVLTTSAATDADPILSKMMKEAE